MSIFSKKPVLTSPVRQLAGATVARRLDANPAIRRANIDTAQIYYHTDFLNPLQCGKLVKLIDTNRRPSTLLSDRADDGFRTSESCDMDRWSPDVRPTDEAIANLLGIDPSHGETMQGQRYAPGQQFRAHHDYFHHGESYWQAMQSSGGQRTWTAMIYLNDVEEGGATWFPQAGIRVAPKRGLLLAWNNMKPDGSPNDKTLHEGMPVVRGTKYIVTKWFREGAWLKG
ncbi:2OG-Fe(II) oxygenase [Sphingomonas sp. So64.6b]|uniref:prolyl hydroxylase family protein n=1 Tax=Sphingomonas sp. So64.6b TaxID=2997354 RepID=UPI0015FF991E|nr:2OG-Fe(II) oxygenase [Sphingomonas sp. So64.6b]QNA84343.1 2OG-Fe(II) oxygenase [Sphingomonas sp. So64.6b]